MVFIIFSQLQTRRISRFSIEIIYLLFKILRAYYGWNEPKRFFTITKYAEYLLNAHKELTTLWSLNSMFLFKFNGKFLAKHFPY